MNNEQGLQEIERTRIIAIMRGVEREHVAAATEALLLGGITVMEITLNSPDALRIIDSMQTQYATQMFIGAGTVLDLQDAKSAIAAGASYLVTPNTDEEVIRWAKSQDIPVFPGAMTPTEIVKAWKAGATAVKVFPSASLGLPYIQELMGPLNHIPLIAVGGVHESNIKQFLDIGCYGVGIGGSLFNLFEIANRNYTWITQKASRLVAASR